MQGFYENHRDDMAHARAWYARDDHFIPHFHNSVEIVYVLEGELRATLNGVTHIVPENMMLINSSYTVHSYETPVSSYSIIAIIPMAEVPSVRRLLSNQSFASCLCPDDEQGTLRALMRLMVACQGGHPLSLKGLSYAVLGQLIERVGLVKTRAGSQAVFVRDVLDYLERRYAEPLSLGSVARHFGYSANRFSHIFSARLGLTLTDYIGVVRCRHAAQLLRETDMAVSEVAMAAGFESLRTFYRTFKKQYNMTPSTYAKA